MPRRFVPPADTPVRSEGLPTHRDVGLYYRQSTEGQIGNVSTTVQTVDMYETLMRMGWQSERIRLIDVDAGVSGRLKIDEREGMRELFGLILDGKVGAVAAQDEDRFFRDETMIQVDIFVDACKRAGVLVITPNCVYDFAHPQMGSFYARQFRFKCEMSAEYINTQIIGKLTSAKRHLLQTGRWAGSSIPLGYMVDIRARIDGAPNPNYRRIVPFAPHARVVRRLFELFVESGGSIGVAHHRMIQEGLRFAELDAPEGYRIRSAPRNPVLTKPGMKGILVNPAYIGHWMYKHAVVRWYNHEAIIPEALFWQAFHYLSPCLLDGSPNPDFRPIHQNARPRREITRAATRPLLVGLAYYNGQPIRATYQPKRSRYVYLSATYNQKTGEADTVWQRVATHIDDAISYHLLKRLESSFSEAHWDALTPPAPDNRHVVLQEQLASVRRRKEAILRGLEEYDEADMRESAQESYRKLKAEETRLLAQLEPEAQRRPLDLNALKAQFGDFLGDGWARMTRDMRHRVLQLMVDRVDCGDYWLHVYWRDGARQWVPFYFTKTTLTYAQLETIRHLIEAGTPHWRIADQFSDQRRDTIYQIIARIKRICKSQSRIGFTNKLCPFSISFLAQFSRRQLVE